jgi:septal ring factor EnvC (AmiA/AmiB activator)
LTQALEGKHEILAVLLGAGVAMAKLPPPSITALARRPIDTARAESLLRQSLPEASQDIDEIKKNLRELGLVQQQTIDVQTRLSGLQNDMQARAGTMAKTLAKRQKLLEKTSQDYAAQTAKMRDLVKRYANLEGLVSGILPDQKTRHADVVEGGAKSTTTVMPKPSLTQRLTQTILGTGKFSPPVVGSIRHKFGEALATGQKRRGLTYATAAGAVVTAPAAGKIVFAGPFHSYRNVVIIDHQNGYHSLIAGLAEANAPAGTVLDAGETVGRIAPDPGANQAQLYYELRQGGDPIDPLSKLRG